MRFTLPSIMRALQLTLVSASTVLGQSQPRFEVPLIVTDGFMTDTLYFGILPGANICIVESDSINGHQELFLPPIPPDGVFDTRFVAPPFRPLSCYDQGSPCDYRPFVSATQRDTLRFRTQMSDSGSGFFASWPSGLSDYFTGLNLRYVSDTGIVLISMLTNTSLNFTNADPQPPVVTIFSLGLVLPPQPPPAPNLLSPPDGAVNVSLLPVLIWNRAPTATSYRVQVATNMLFTQVVFDDSTLTDTSRQVGQLNANTLYYWHVRGRNIGGAGPYSDPFRFTTIDVPPAPSLISPPDGAVNVSLLPTLTWSSVATASTYHLQVARDSLYTQLEFNDSTLTGTSRQVGPLTASTLYYWHVRAKNMAGASPYSGNFRFTTTAAPPAPELISPADSATAVPVPVVFSWTSVPSATHYHLQVATSPAFTLPVFFEDSMITGTTRTVASIPYSAILHWRVRARNSSGASEFTPSRIFTAAMPPPGAPALLYPADNQTNVPVDTLMRWRNAVLASGFHLIVARDQLFTNIFFQDSTIADTVRRVRFEPSGSYHWKVRAHNVEHTWGNFSLTRAFTTVNGPPAVPIPIYPAYWDSNVTRIVTLRWIGSPGAIRYRAQVSLNPSFTQLVVNDSTTATEYTTPLLAPLTTYFWRVNARGMYAQPSEWCPYQPFRTGTTTAVEGQENQVPTGFVLHQNYPNPFNPSTTFRFDIPYSSFVSLKLYDMLGREVATLVNDEMNPGIYERTFDASGLPSGIYLVRMNAVGVQEKKIFTETKKIILLR
jgi:transposase-like protein